MLCVEKRKIKKSTIEYRIENKININSNLTRKEQNILNKIDLFLKELKTNKEEEMIKYIYYECFNEKENNIDKIYKAIFNELKYNFNSIGPKIYTFYKIKKNQCI